MLVCCCCCCCLCGCCCCWGLVVGVPLKTKSFEIFGLISNWIEMNCYLFLMAVRSHFLPVSVSVIISTNASATLLLDAGSCVCVCALWFDDFNLRRPNWWRHSVTCKYRRERERFGLDLGFSICIYLKGGIAMSSSMFSMFSIFSISIKSDQCLK